MHSFQAPVGTGIVDFGFVASSHRMAMDDGEASSSCPSAGLLLHLACDSCPILKGNLLAHNMQASLVRLAICIWSYQCAQLQFVTASD